MKIEVRPDGNVTMYDVYERIKGSNHTWTKDHGEFPSAETAQASCDSLAQRFPNREYKVKSRRGMKAAVYEKALKIAGVPCERVSVS